MNLKITLKRVKNSFLRISYTACYKLIEKPWYELNGVRLLTYLKFLITCSRYSLGEFMGRDLPFKTFWIPHFFN